MSCGADLVRTVLRGTGQTLITVGVVLLLFCVYELKVTNLVTALWAQEQLADDLREQWDAPIARFKPVADTGPDERCGGPSAADRGPDEVVVPPVELGSGIAVLRIPRLGDWNDRPPVVVEGVSTSDLKKGPGHIPGTALPGEVGNVVLSGHRTTYGAPFERFDELQPGDAVVVETRDTWFTYTVRGTAHRAPVGGRGHLPGAGRPRCHADAAAAHHDDLPPALLGPPADGRLRRAHRDRRQGQRDAGRARAAAERGA